MGYIFLGLLLMFNAMTTWVPYVHLSRGVSFQGVCYSFQWGLLRVLSEMAYALSLGVCKMSSDEGHVP